MKLSDLQNTEEGVVDLLGCGPTLNNYKNTTRKQIGTNASDTKVDSLYHIYFNGEAWLMENGDFATLRANAGTSIALVIFKEYYFVIPRIPPPYQYSSNLTLGSYARFAGLLAIEFAEFLGFDEAHLYGYGCHDDEGHFNNPNDKTNRHQMLPYFEEVKKKTKMKIVNLTKESAIDCFERMEEW